MSGVTNRIPFEEAADMLTRARACVAYVVDGAPHVEPALVTSMDERFLVGVAEGAAPGPGVGEVALVVDEGVLFFDLRAIYVRGIPRAIEHAPEAARTWFEIEPTKVTCWDYGRLRVGDGAD